MVEAKKTRYAPRCRKCGSNDIATTLRGFFGDHDPNTYTCQQCGATGTIGQVQPTDYEER